MSLRRRGQGANDSDGAGAMTSFGRSAALRWRARARSRILWLDVLAKSRIIIGGWYWDRTSGPCRVKPGLSMYASFVIGEAVPATPDFFDVVFCNIDRKLG